MFSCACTAHPQAYTLTNKNFTFSRKPTVGCLSELLENCVGVFWYEGHMVNYKICLFGAQFASVCVNSRDREGEIRSWSLLVGNGRQNGNVCEPSYNNHKIYWEYRRRAFDRFDRSTGSSWERRVDDSCDTELNMIMAYFERKGCVRRNLYLNWWCSRCSVGRSCSKAFSALSPSYFFFRSKTFLRIIFSVIFVSIQLSTCWQNELHWIYFLSFHIWIQISH